MAMLSPQEHNLPFTPSRDHTANGSSNGYFPTLPTSSDSRTPLTNRRIEQHNGFLSSSTDQSTTHHHAHHATPPAHYSSGKGLQFRKRIKHFTWTWFTMTMATGGIANVLYHVPFAFHGRYALGCSFFLLNIVLFLFNVAMISCRFKIYPATFYQSITHPTESLFIPAWLISMGTILINITEYGAEANLAGTWLLETMNVLFWIYCGMAVAFSCGIYLILSVRPFPSPSFSPDADPPIRSWSTQTFTMAQMTPVWIFPAYPLLVIGPHASVLASRLTPTHALPIIIGGVVFQGIGFLVSLMIYAAFIYRLMTQKLPQESLRPGMFISVGPSGFTIAGIVGMGREMPRVVPPNFMGEGLGKLAGDVSMILANWTGLWLWGLAFWFFLVSVFAHWSTVRHNRWQFAMTWYSYVFPNTALVTATFAIAEALNCHAIRVLGCVMTCLLVLVWVTVFGCMVRAVVVRDILWPQKQEDRDEGGFKAKEAEGMEEEGMGSGSGSSERSEDGEGATGMLARVVSRFSRKGKEDRGEREEDRGGGMV